MRQAPESPRPPIWRCHPLATGRPGFWLAAGRATRRGRDPPRPMRADYSIPAGFAVQCPVTPRVTNQHGTSIDARLISQVTIRSDAGQQLSLAPGRTSWLGCLQPSYRASAIVSRPLAYSVQSIVFAGTDIVDGGVQRFQPGRTPRPVLVGYFDDLTITAHDALFGGPM